jgi:hypothetical protein
MKTAPAPAVPLSDALSDAIELDLTRARTRLIAARAHQRVKDSTGNRARVAECREQIDVLLDTYLAVRSAPWSASVSAGLAPAVG